MINLDIRHYKFRYLSLIFIFLSIFIYLTYHALNGERGIIALVNLSNKFNKLENNLEQVRAQRIYLEHKVNLLRSESLDLDLLDEQARKILGYSKETEAVYFFKKEDK